MSDNEIFEEETNESTINTDEPNVVIDVKDLEEEEKPTPKVKQKKPRKKVEMTPERTAQLLENLKKGRETAKRNRMKTAQYKKLMKEKERKKVDEVLEEDYKQRNNKTNYKLENEKLIEKIKLLESKQLETIKEEEPPKLNKEETKVFVEEPKVIEEPKIEPPKPKVIRGGRNGGSIWSQFK